VAGPRFAVFFPLGSRILLEQDLLFLAEAYRWSPRDVMSMPSSQRHRFVKMKEEISRQQVAESKGQTTPDSVPVTGLDSKRSSAQQRTVGLSYKH